MLIALVSLGAAVIADCLAKPRADDEGYGLTTGTAGIRGMHFRPFTQAEIAAYNREGAAQGLRGVSVAPTPSGPGPWAPY